MSSEPLTPADCDLRSVPAMLLDVQRFRDSDLVVLEKPEAIVAAILLWGASWHQVPAASLPDDDRMLAQLAGYGRSVSAWKRVKAGALRGFIKCSDGRLYHPVVAEKACGMWEDKLQRSHGRFCAAIRKHNERQKQNERKGVELVAPTFEAWLTLGRPDKVADVVCDTTKCHKDKDAPSRGQEASVVCETASNITELNRTELNQYKKASLEIDRSLPKPSLAREKPPPGITDAPTALSYVCAEADWHASTDRQRQEAIWIIRGWLEAGCTLELILDGIAKARKRDPAPTKSLKRFDSTIRGMRKDQLGGELPHTAAEVRAIADATAKRLSVQ